MEEKQGKPNNPNSERKSGKKPYYKKRYNPQPRKRKFWNADKIVGLSAMSIALFTLVVLLYQSHILDKQYELTVKQQKASVLPYLLLGPSLQEDKFVITLQNKGLGPAFIEGLYVKENDSVFLLDNILDSFFEDIRLEESNLNKISYSSIFHGLALEAGGEMELILAEGENSALESLDNFYSKFFSGNSRNVFIVEYQSVFEESWVVTSSFQNATKKEFGEFEIFYEKVE